MTPRQHAKEVERDMGQSFNDIIQSFADDGYTPTDTACTLDVPYPIFSRLLDTRDLWHLFRKPEVKRSMEPIEEEPETVPETIKPKRQKNTARKGRGSKILYVTYDGLTLPLAHHADRLGINRDTVKRRYYRRPDDLDYIFATTYHKPERVKG